MTGNTINAGEAFQVVYQWVDASNLNDAADNYRSRPILRPLRQAQGSDQAQGRRGRIESVAYTVFFSLSFSRPLETLGVWSADVPEEWRGGWPDRAYKQWKTPAYIEAIRGASVDALPESGELQGEHIGIFAEWPTGADEQILVKAGISFVSM